MQDDKAFDQAMNDERRGMIHKSDAPDFVKKQEGIPTKVIKSFAEAHEKATRKKRPPRKLIFLSGFANTGKDTVCELLTKISPEPVIRIALADALKSECYPTLGKEYDPKDDNREWKDAHRPQIIQYGEGQKQEHGQYYWIRRALEDEMNKVYEREMDIPHIIVTDVRRTEEVMWLKHYKVGHFAELERARTIWEPIMFVVHREGAESDKDYLTHIALEYAAETRVFMSMIRNYGSMKDLDQQLKDLYVCYIR